MNSVRAFLFILLLLKFTFAPAQTPPEGVGVVLYPPTTPNRIEVRFAISKKAVRCQYFHLTAKIEGREIFAGRFKSGFDIPKGLADIPGQSTLELDFICNNHRWHFAEIGERAFLEGYWWVGTSYPPFIEELQRPEFRNLAWINYLIIRPSKEPGFIVYKQCPKELKNKKPGPCYDDRGGSGSLDSFP
jgi:hypothetical protein